MSILTIKRGDTWKVTFTYKQPDGSPLDLTGCSARLQVRSKSNGELLLSADTTLGGLTLTPAEGLLTLTAATDDLPVGSHEFDLEMTYADGSIQSTDTMILKVLADISRD